VKVDGEELVVMREEDVMAIIRVEVNHPKTRQWQPKKYDLATMRAPTLVQGASTSLRMR